MQLHKRLILTGLVLISGSLAGPGSAFAASQSFKDEAGRVIYTIDDDGTVSMFENSPTDLTISTTRGTREQMAPQVTEVLPDTVPAGAPAVLKLKGKNLVGATVKLSVPAIEVGSYATKPRSLDLPIRVPHDVPAGDVTIEISTPIGSTKTTFKIKDLPIGGSSPAGRDGSSPALSTSAPATCPAGMIGVGAELGGFCIEIDRSFSGDWRAAEKACAIKGARLCQALEWQHACKQTQGGTIPLKNIIGNWEWTGSWDPYQYDPRLEAMDLTPDIRSILLGKEDCEKRLISPRWRTESFQGRCCK
jgi:hypothetical protein